MTGKIILQKTTLAILAWLCGYLLLFYLPLPFQLDVTAAFLISAIICFALSSWIILEFSKIDITGNSIAIILLLVFIKNKKMIY